MLRVLGFRVLGVAAGQLQKGSGFHVSCSENAFSRHTHRPQYGIKQGFRVSLFSWG